MRIIQVCYKYPPIFSGYGKQLKTINKSIEQINKEINFKILTGKFEYKRKCVEQFEVISLGFKFLNKLSPVLHLYSFALMVFFRILFNSKNLDVVHCIKAGPEAAFAVLAGKIINKPIIVKIAQDEFSEVEKRKGNLVNKIVRKIRDNIILKADAYIAINSDIKSRLLSRGIDSNIIYSIPNGVDNNKFFKITLNEKEELKAKLQIPNKSTNIIYSGSISKRKGIFDLLAALESLESESQIHTMICGPMYENEECFYSLINKINNQQNNVSISYRGEVNNIEDYLRASDILVLPSYSEGLPNVLLEGSMTGLAMIATNIKGSSDIINHEINGLLFQPGDIDALKYNIKKLAENEEYCSMLGDEIYSKGKKKYEVSIVANEYIKLYHKLKKERV
ncbi:glycosyltransferase family 4 protein [Virgibacillus chiguensis]|uniref:Glycosyltransferase involved in cell wall bisynthesis n=1 Tax=Virgibacillus chiguensis TaxID=411959 RepID=A0A1M5QKX1_9BACI|nr:glycosyltransferase family 4 protein [Virgibacillus chiguensis]SHH14459.1 Glycosyltransferase involved in cell wall bisynthesis [Virgibacillus chiguensis]